MGRLSLPSPTPSTERRLGGRWSAALLRLEGERTRIKRKLPFIHTVGAVYRGRRTCTSTASLFLKRTVTAG